MRLPAGLTLEDGHSVPCLAAAPVSRPETGHALSHSTEDNHALRRVSKGKSRAAMHPLAGLTMESGQSALCLAEELAHKQGLSLASNQSMEDSRALSKAY